MKKKPYEPKGLPPEAFEPRTKYRPSGSPYQPAIPVQQEPAPRRNDHAKR